MRLYQTSFLAQLSKRTLSFFVFYVLTLSFAEAQDVERILSADPFKMSGGISMRGYSFGSDAPNARNDVGYSISVNVNASIYGIINLPVNLMFSQNQTSLTTPRFQRLGFSPSYKWITVHAGHRSYVTNSYIASGITISGIGLELKPKGFRFLAYTGKARNRNTLPQSVLAHSNTEIELYTRRVFGGLIGVNNKAVKAELSVLKTSDDPNSGNLEYLTANYIPASESVGAGLDFRLNPAKFFTLEAKSAISVVTHDLSTKPFDANESEQKLINSFSSILIINESTKYGLAYSGRVGINIARSSIGYRYEHIDPYFTSPGRSLVFDDFDNHLFDFRTTLSKGKFNFNGSIGFQTRNTKGYFSKNETRTIGNASCQWRVNKDLNIAFNFSNFNSSGRQNVAEVLDSIVFTTNTTGLNSSISYTLPSQGQDASRLSLNIGFNQFSIVHGNDISSTNNAQNIVASWSKSLKESGWQYGANANFQQHNSAQRSNMRFGVGGRLGKTITKAFSVNASPTFNANFTSKERDGFVFNLYGGLVYKFEKLGSINFNLGLIHRNTRILNPINQYRLSLGYNKTF